MKKVNEILNDTTSFFTALKVGYADLWHELFQENTPTALDIQLLVKCGERYASPLLTHYEIAKVVEFIATKYGESWKRIDKTLKLEYDVLKPYNVEQSTTVEKTATNTNSGVSRQENGIVAFDSDTATPSTVDTNADSNTQNVTENETTTVVNSGNNGNMKYTDLITNEIEVRKNSFIDLVLNDIQSQITLDIY